MARDAAAMMWAEALAKLARTDRLHRDFFRPAVVGWEPPIDVLETETALIMIVALPGVRAADVELGISNGELTIIGTRIWPAALHRARVHRMELPHGRFERRVMLPPGSYELVQRDLLDGCLTISLRKLG